jgi:hypothetical protein
LCAKKKNVITDENAEFGGLNFYLFFLVISSELLVKYSPNKSFATYVKPLKFKAPMEMLERDHYFQCSI